jgi:hypothetical protein
MPDVPFNVIHNGSGSYNIPGGVYIVRDQPELETFWGTPGGTPAPDTRAPGCQLGQYDRSVRAARNPADPRIPLRIERIIAEGTGVRVFAVETPKHPDWITTQNLTAPYQMVTMPRFEGPAELTMEISTEEP